MTLNKSQSSEFLDLILYNQQKKKVEQYTNKKCYAFNEVFRFEDILPVLTGGSKKWSETKMGDCTFSEIVSNETCFKILDKPIDPDCTVAVSGKKFRGTFNVQLDPVLEDMLCSKVKELQQFQRSRQNLQKRKSIMSKFTEVLTNIVKDNCNCIPFNCCQNPKPKTVCRPLIRKRLAVKRNCVHAKLRSKNRLKNERTQSEVNNSFGAFKREKLHAYKAQVFPEAKETKEKLEQKLPEQSLEEVKVEPNEDKNADDGGHVDSATEDESEESSASFIPERIKYEVTEVMASKEITENHNRVENVNNMDNRICELHGKTIVCTHHNNTKTLINDSIASIDEVGEDSEFVEESTASLLEGISSTSFTSSESDYYELMSAYDFLNTVSNAPELLESNIHRAKRFESLCARLHLSKSSKESHKKEEETLIFEKIPDETYIAVNSGVPDLKDTQTAVFTVGEETNNKCTCSKSKCLLKNAKSKEESPEISNNDRKEKCAKPPCKSVQYSNVASNVNNASSTQEKEKLQEENLKDQDMEDGLLEARSKKIKLKEPSKNSELVNKMDQNLAQLSQEISKEESPIKLRHCKCCQCFGSQSKLQGNAISSDVGVASDQADNELTPTEPVSLTGSPQGQQNTNPVNEPDSRKLENHELRDKPSKEVNEGLKTNKCMCHKKTEPEYCVIDKNKICKNNTRNYANEIEKTGTQSGFQETKNENDLDNQTYANIDPNVIKELCQKYEKECKGEKANRPLCHCVREEKTAIKENQNQPQDETNKSTGNGLIIREEDVFESSSKSFGNTKIAKGKNESLSQTSSTAFVGFPTEALGKKEPERSLGNEQDRARSLGYEPDRSRHIGYEPDRSRSLGMEPDQARSLGNESNQTRSLRKEDPDRTRSLQEFCPMGKEQEQKRSLGKTPDQTRSLKKEDPDRTRSLGKEASDRAKSLGMEPDRTKSLGKEPDRSKSLGYEAPYKTRSLGKEAPDQTRSIGKEVPDRAESLGIEPDRPKSLGMELEQSKSQGYEDLDRRSLRKTEIKEISEDSINEEYGEQKSTAPTSLSQHPLSISEDSKISTKDAATATDKDTLKSARKNESDVVKPSDKMVQTEPKPSKANEKCTPIPLKDDDEYKIILETIEKREKCRYAPPLDKERIKSKYSAKNEKASTEKLKEKCKYVPPKNKKEECIKKLKSKESPRYVSTISKYSEEKDAKLSEIRKSKEKCKSASKASKSIDEQKKKSEPVEPKKISENEKNLVSPKEPEVGEGVNNKHDLESLEEPTAKESNKSRPISENIIQNETKSESIKEPEAGTPLLTSESIKESTNEKGTKSFKEPGMREKSHSVPNDAKKDLSSRLPPRHSERTKKTLGSREDWKEPDVGTSSSLTSESIKESANGKGTKSFKEPGMREKSHSVPIDAKKEDSSSRLPTRHSEGTKKTLGSREDWKEPDVGTSSSLTSESIKESANGKGTKSFKEPGMREKSHSVPIDAKKEDSSSRLPTRHSEGTKKTLGSREDWKEGEERRTGIPRLKRTNTLFYKDKKSRKDGVSSPAKNQIINSTSAETKSTLQLNSRHSQINYLRLNILNKLKTTMMKKPIIFDSMDTESYISQYSDSSSEDEKRRRQWSRSSYMSVKDGGRKGKNEKAKIKDKLFNESSTQTAVQVTEIRQEPKRTSRKHHREESESDSYDSNGEEEQRNGKRSLSFESYISISSTSSSLRRWNDEERIAASRKYTEVNSQTSNHMANWSEKLKRISSISAVGEKFYHERSKSERALSERIEEEENKSSKKKSITKYLKSRDRPGKSKNIFANTTAHNSENSAASSKSSFELVSKDRQYCFKKGNILSLESVNKELLSVEGPKRRCREDYTRRISEKAQQLLKERRKKLKEEESKITDGGKLSSDSKPKTHLSRKCSKSEPSLVHDSNTSLHVPDEAPKVQKKMKIGNNSYETNVQPKRKILRESSGPPIRGEGFNSFSPFKHDDYLNHLNNLLQNHRYVSDTSSPIRYNPTANKKYKKPEINFVSEEPSSSGIQAISNTDFYSLVSRFNSKEMRLQGNRKFQDMLEEDSSVMGCQIYESLEDISKTNMRSEKSSSSYKNQSLPHSGMNERRKVQFYTVIKDAEKIAPSSKLKKVSLVKLLKPFEEDEISEETENPSDGLYRALVEGSSNSSFWHSQGMDGNYIVLVQETAEGGTTGKVQNLEEEVYEDKEYIEEVPENKKVDTASKEKIEKAEVQKPEETSIKSKPEEAEHKENCCTCVELCPGVSLQSHLSKCVVCTQQFNHIANCNTSGHGCVQICCSHNQKTGADACVCCTNPKDNNQDTTTGHSSKTNLYQNAQGVIKVYVDPTSCYCCNACPGSSGIRRHQGDLRNVCCDETSDMSKYNCCCCGGNELKVSEKETETPSKTEVAVDLEENTEVASTKTAKSQLTAGSRGSNPNEQAANLENNNQNQQIKSLKSNDDPSGSVKKTEGGNRCSCCKACPGNYNNFADHQKEDTTSTNKSGKDPSVKSTPLDDTEVRKSNNRQSGSEINELDQEPMNQIQYHDQKEPMNQIQYHDQKEPMNQIQYHDQKEPMNQIQYQNQKEPMKQIQYHDHKEPLNNQYPDQGTSRTNKNNRSVNQCSCCPACPRGGEGNGPQFTVIVAGQPQQPNNEVSSRGSQNLSESHVNELMNQSRSSRESQTSKRIGEEPNDARSLKEVQSGKSPRTSGPKEAGDMKPCSCCPACPRNGEEGERSQAQPLSGNSRANSGGYPQNNQNSSKPYQMMPIEDAQRDIYENQQRYQESDPQKKLCSCCPACPRKDEVKPENQEMSVVPVQEPERTSDASIKSTPSKVNKQSQADLSLSGGSPQSMSEEPIQDRRSSEQNPPNDPRQSSVSMRTFHSKEEFSGPVADPEALEDVPKQDTQSRKSKPPSGEELRDKSMQYIPEPDNVRRTDKLCTCCDACPKEQRRGGDAREVVPVVLKEGRRSKRPPECSDPPFTYNEYVKGRKYCFSACYDMDPRCYDTPQTREQIRQRMIRDKSRSDQFGKDLINESPRAPEDAVMVQTASLKLESPYRKERRSKSSSKDHELKTVIPSDKMPVVYRIPRRSKYMRMYDEGQVREPGCGCDASTRHLHEVKVRRKSRHRRELPPGGYMEEITVYNQATHPPGRTAISKCFCKADRQTLDALFRGENPQGAPCSCSKDKK